MEKRKPKCPECGWEPNEESMWICINCGHNWNTFETDRICPKCGKDYPRTQCLNLKCTKWSSYSDWFEK